MEWMLVSLAHRAMVEPDACFSVNLTDASWEVPQPAMCRATDTNLLRGSSRRSTLSPSGRYQTLYNQYYAALRENGHRGFKENTVWEFFFIVHLFCTCLCPNMLIPLTGRIIARILMLHRGLKSPFYHQGKRQRLKAMLPLFSISWIFFHDLFASVSSLAVLLRCSFVNQDFLVRKLDVHYIFSKIVSLLLLWLLLHDLCVWIISNHTMENKVCIWRISFRWVSKLIGELFAFWNDPHPGAAWWQHSDMNGLPIGVAEASWFGEKLVVTFTPHNTHIMKIIIHWSFCFLKVIRHSHIVICFTLPLSNYFSPIPNLSL